MGAMPGVYRKRPWVDWKSVRKTLGDKCPQMEPEEVLAAVSDGVAGLLVYLDDGRIIVNKFGDPVNTWNPVWYRINTYIDEVDAGKAAGMQWLEYEYAHAKAAEYLREFGPVPPEYRYGPRVRWLDV